VAALTAGFVLLILFLRRPEAFAHPTLWAEDGSLFLAQSETFGLGAFTIPYNGYYHFLQRLIALAVSPIDLRWIPCACLIGAIGVLTGLVLAIFSPRLPVRCRPVMACALVLVPHSGEVHDNLTNVQWFGALGLLLLVIARDPTSPWQRMFDLVTAVILGLTGVYSFLFAPFFAWRWWFRRDPHSGWLAAIVFTCAAVQAGAIYRADLLAPEPWRVSGSIARTLALRTSGSLFLPPSAAHASPTWSLVLLASVMLALIVRNGLAETAFRSARFIYLAAVLLLVAGTLYRFRGDVFVLRQFTDGDRYFFVPKVLLLWLLIWQIPSRGFAAWTARGLCAGSLFATCTAWRFEPYHDYGWAEHVAKLEHTAEVTIPINPSGQTVRLHARR